MQERKEENTHFLAEETYSVYGDLKLFAVGDDSKFLLTTLKTTSQKQTLRLDWCTGVLLRNQ